MFKNIFRTKSPSEVSLEAAKGGHKLKKTLGSVDLLTLGIGAIIGAGVFIITGTAAAGDITSSGEIIRIPAGPAITLSFLLTAIGCGFCALCYAEFASMVPVAGSAYVYSYISMGEVFAWIIGWALLLEYTFAASTVAIGWAGYFQQVLEKVLHIQLPEYLLTPWFVALGDMEKYSHFPHVFSYPISINLPAILIIAFLTLLLIRGVKESANANNVIVVLKLVIIAIFVIVGAFYVDKSNWVPYMPYGFRGILAGSAMIFFSYIGFDALTTVSEEVKNPGRDLPIGIIGSLLICTIIYIIVSAVLTGIAPYSLLNTPDPVATALDHVGQSWLASYIVSVGAVIALLSALLVVMMGQPRIIFSMSRDGFLPPLLSRVHSKYKTPYITTIISGSLIMFMAGVCDITKVSELCNIGTLFAFIVVSAGVVILRYRDPDHPRAFKVPFVPFLPIVGVIICLALLLSLPKLAWIGFFVWLTTGLVIYFSYGIKHTKYNSQSNIEEDKTAEEVHEEK